jgi:hypothetical protein
MLYKIVNNFTFLLFLSKSQDNFYIFLLYCNDIIQKSFLSFINFIIIIYISFRIKSNKTNNDSQSNLLYVKIDCNTSLFPS